MNVLIKNMEMPKACYNCKFIHYFNNGKIMCRRTGNEIINKFMLNNNCPLIGISDELLKELEKNYELV